MLNTKRKAWLETPALEIKPELLDELVKGHEQFETMFQGLKRAIVERALAARLTHHLGYAKGEEVPDDQSNHRNGASPNGTDRHWSLEFGDPAIAMVRWTAADPQGRAPIQRIRREDHPK